MWRAVCPPLYWIQIFFPRRMQRRLKLYIFMSFFWPWAWRRHRLRPLKWLRNSAYPRDCPWRPMTIHDIATLSLQVKQFYIAQQESFMNSWQYAATWNEILQYFLEFSAIFRSLNSSRTTSATSHHDFWKIHFKWRDFFYNIQTILWGLISSC